MRFIFEKAFTGRNGEGYPPERKEPQVRNAGILNTVKAAVVKENYLDTLRAIDPELVKPPFPGRGSSNASSKTAVIKKSKLLSARLLVDRAFQTGLHPCAGLFAMVFLCWIPCCQHLA